MKLKSLIFAALALVATSTACVPEAQAQFAEGNQVIQAFKLQERLGGLTLTAPSSGAYRNDGYRGVHCFLQITEEVSTATLAIKLQGWDPVQNVYYDLTGWELDTKSATGNDYLVIYPGIAETANESVSDVLPAWWRVHATTTTDETDSFTFGLTCEMLR